MAVFHVVEKFVSINGEGQHAGELAVFIRLRGCNLKCNYCDTRWACNEDAKADEMTEADIVSYVISTGVKRVTLTGGEPLLADNAIDLLEAFAVHKDIIVEIETNGAVSIGSLYELSKKLMLNDELSITLDYKCPGSGMTEYMLMENYEMLRKSDTVKFVVSDQTDMDKALEIIEKKQLIERGIAVYFSPVFGKIKSAEIVDFMISHRLNGVTHQLQQHKFIWDPEMRGV